MIIAHLSVLIFRLHSRTSAIMRFIHWLFPGTSALPDIYALALGRCTPLGSHAYISGKELAPAWVITYTYNYVIKNLKFKMK